VDSRAFLIWEENVMRKGDGFPHGMAIGLGLAMATALSFLVAFAFGGLPWF
jgi:hypothetical protein